MCRPLPRWCDGSGRQLYRYRRAIRRRLLVYSLVVVDFTGGEVCPGSVSCRRRFHATIFVVFASPGAVWGVAPIVYTGSPWVCVGSGGRCACRFEARGGWEGPCTLDMRVIHRKLVSVCV